VPAHTIMKVLLTGATGAAGLGILRSLLTDNGVTQVTYLGRRPLPHWVVLPGGTSTEGASPTHPKLSTIEHKDFLTYTPAIQEKVAQHDACIWALGISTAGMSEAKYTEITVGYFNSFLNVLKEKAVGTEESPFRVVFVSGKGADSTEKSRILFARVKGRAENDLIKAVHEAGGRLRGSILRPGYFFPVQSISTGRAEPTRAYPTDCGQTLWPTSFDILSVRRDIRRANGSIRTGGRSGKVGGQVWPGSGLRKCRDDGSFEGPLNLCVYSDSTRQMYPF